MAAILNLVRDWKNLIQADAAFDGGIQKHKSLKRIHHCNFISENDADEIEKHLLGLQLSKAAVEAETNRAPTGVDKYLV